MKARLFLAPLASAIATAAILFACGSDSKREAFVDPDAEPVESGPAFSEAGLEASALLPLAPPDPKTCDEAAAQRSYVGCEFWPTITSNLVNKVFDFAVAIANNSADTPVNVTVDGNGQDQHVVVAPGALQTIYLPWIPELKGPETDGLSVSVLYKKGAYHITTDQPVVVYQFSPLEFQAVGGPAGKDWSSCDPNPGASACYSYSNDASLLLPTTALTATYRVMGMYGFSEHPYNQSTGTFDTSQPLQALAATALTITATHDDTSLEIQLGKRANVVTPDMGTDAGVDAGSDAGDAGDAGDDAGDADVDAGTDSGVDAGTDSGADAGDPNLGHLDPVPLAGTFVLKLNKGDVAELVAGMGQTFDFSGTIVRGNHPVQVITSVPCIFLPQDVFACDHIEETVFPATTMGKHYVVTTPTGPLQNKVAHYVRIYGNTDGTTLTYKPSKPADCPDTVNAGDIFECQNVSNDFEIIGDKGFGVGMFMLGGQIVDPTGAGTATSQGDPSESFAVPVEQYRQKYVFLAPTDYKENYVDLVSGPETKVQLDGADVTGQLVPIAGTTFTLARIKLVGTNGGVHTVTSTRPVGIQIAGYGDYTSYWYPGGLNLVEIEPAPK